MKEERKVNLNFAKMDNDVKSRVTDLAAKAAEALAVKSGSLTILGRSYGEDKITLLHHVMYARDGYFEGELEAVLLAMEEEYIRDVEERNVLIIADWEYRTKSAIFSHDPDVIATQFIRSEQTDWAIVNCDLGRLYISFQSKEMKNPAYRVGIVFAVAMYLAQLCGDRGLSQSAGVLERELVSFEQAGSTFCYEELCGKMLDLIEDFSSNQLG